VPEYDAFGREIGENTLAGLGGSEPRPVVAEPQPVSDPIASDTDVDSSQVATPPAFTAPTVRVRRRGGTGCLVGLIVLAVIAAAPIIAVVSIVGSASDAIDGVTDVFESLPDEPTIPDAPEPPVGIGGDSLVERANLAAALEQLAGMGRATTMRLAPDRIDALLVSGSRQRLVQLTFDRSLTRGPAADRGGGPPAIPLAAIDPGAPARLVRGSAARFNVRPRGIDYLVLSPAPGDGHRWIAYFKNGVYVEGDRRGRVVRRIS
jgi:hypothetical protein